MKLMVLGGYGHFGKRLVRSLLHDDRFEVVVAGRNSDRLEALQEELATATGKLIGCKKLDIFAPQFKRDVATINPDVLINVVGPFQNQCLFTDKTTDYKVARICLELRCHYVDLADDRAFVAGFSEALNKEAVDKKLTLITGASTVPALTDAVLRNYQNQFAQLQTLDYGISPGNQTERGEGTIASILHTTGQPFSTRIDDNLRTVWGWQNLRRVDLGYPLGKRWMSNCNIPDLDLIPQQFPDIKTIRFQAGLEVGLMHLGLWAMSYVSRMGWIHNWQRFSNRITALSRWFENWGSDCGGMFMDMKGVDRKGNQKLLHWQLIAEKGVGPNVPIIAAELVIKKILEDKMTPGARPCMNLFSMKEFFDIAKRWNIYYRVERRGNERRDNFCASKGEFI